MPGHRLPIGGNTAERLFWAVQGEVRLHQQPSSSCSTANHRADYESNRRRSKAVESSGRLPLQGAVFIALSWPIGLTRRGHGKIPLAASSPSRGWSAARRARKQRHRLDSGRSSTRWLACYIHIRMESCMPAAPCLLLHCHPIRSVAEHGNQVVPPQLLVGDNGGHPRATRVAILVSSVSATM
jgi:hypothetical protein